MPTNIHALAYEPYCRQETQHVCNLSHFPFRTSPRHKFSRHEPGHLRRHLPTTGAGHIFKWPSPCTGLTHQCTEQRRTSQLRSIFRSNLVGAVPLPMAQYALEAPIASWWVCSPAVQKVQLDTRKQLVANLGFSNTQ